MLDPYRTGIDTAMHSFFVGLQGFNDALIRNAGLFVNCETAEVVNPISNETMTVYGIESNAISQRGLADLCFCDAAYLGPDGRRGVSHFGSGKYLEMYGEQDKTYGYKGLLFPSEHTPLLELGHLMDACASSDWLARQNQARRWFIVLNRPGAGASEPRHTHMHLLPKFSTYKHKETIHEDGLLARILNCIRLPDKPNRAIHNRKSGTCAIVLHHPTFMFHLRRDDITSITHWSAILFFIVSRIESMPDVSCSVIFLSGNEVIIVPRLKRDKSKIGWREMLGGFPKDKFADSKSPNELTLEILAASVASEPDQTALWAVIDEAINKC